MRWIAAALAALIAAPVVAAHATPEGAEYEHLVWQDGTYHQTYYQDGYDLHDLWMWEAYDAALGDGMMLRFHVFGGNTTGIYDTMWIHAQLGVGNETHSFSWWSTDDVTWQGDLPVTLLASERTAGPLSDLPDEVAGQLPALPDVGGGWAHEMQVFVPLSAINATVGDTVTGWTWHTTAERDAATGGRVQADVDVAPGGFWITGSPRALQVEGPSLPDPDAEPGLPADAEPIAFFLEGAGRHLEAAGEWDDGEVIVRIRNPYNATTQLLSVAAPAHAHATTGTTQSVAPGQEAVFRFDVPLASAPQHLAWDVLSDIGGHARLELSLPAAPEPEPAPPGTTSAPAPAPAPDEAPKPLVRTDPTASPTTAAPAPDPSSAGKDAPMGAWVGLVAFAVVLLRRRH